MRTKELVSLSFLASYNKKKIYSAILAQAMCEFAIANENGEIRNRIRCGSDYFLNILQKYKFENFRNVLDAKCIYSSY